MKETMASESKSETNAENKAEVGSGWVGLGWVVDIQGISVIRKGKRLAWGVRPCERMGCSSGLAALQADGRLA